MPFELAGLVLYGNFISPLDVDPAWDIKGTLKSNKMYNGLGPYYVDENESVSKQMIVLKKRDSWRDDLNFHKPKMDKVVLEYITDPQTSIMALEKGDINYICRYWNPALDSLSALEKNSEISINTRPDTRTYYITTAHWRKPFNGTEGILLRKAICYALDRNEIANGAFNGYATPASDTMFLSPLDPNVPECCHKGYGYDLEKAKKLLADAGWTDTDGDGILDKNGTDLKDLDLLITSDTTLSWQKDIALVVQSQLKRIGINVNIRTLELKAYQTAQKAGEYDLCLSYTNARWVSMIQQFDVFDSNKVTSIKIQYGNQNGSLERLAQNIRAATSKEERDKDICQACNILYEEAGVIPLVHPTEYALMRSNVKGFEFESYWAYVLDNVAECWIED